jgi:hypothetical protein
VLQRYIAKPLLIDKKKFDYRFFVAVPCLKPFAAFLYQGFSRKTISDYKTVSVAKLEHDIA